MNPLPALQRYLLAIFVYIFKLGGFALRKLAFVGREVPFEDKASDFFDIFNATRIFFLFNLLAFFVFTFLPQGKDVILVVIEGLSDFNPWSLLSLLGSLICWSIVSEFGARYKIYVTDNSGLSLSDERVNFRKEAQKFVSSIYLLLPVVIVMLSVIIVSFNNIQIWNWQRIWPFATVLILLLLLFALMSKYYLDYFYVAVLRASKVWFKVSDKELEWANRLYGIYNDYVLMVRKGTNFKDDMPIGKDENGNDLFDRPPDGDVREKYNAFTDRIEQMRKPDNEPVENVNDFPRNYLKKDELPPVEFTEVTFSPNNYTPEINPDRGDDKSKPEFINKLNSDGYYRWIYKSTPSFYKTLHFQLHVIVASSFSFIFLVSTGLLVSYEAIGSPALVCLSFACWLGIYTGLLYIDSRFKNTLKISVRWVLFCWFLIVSFINKDHPVRNNGDTGFRNERLSLNKHFDLWTSAHLKKNDGTTFIINQKPDSSNCKEKINQRDSFFYPVYFITAEGGALRTGAFTAMVLARLQDTFPDFKDHIYAFSSVSGGSVGISFFNAVNYLEPSKTQVPPHYFRDITNKYFQHDQLSCVVAKLFYSDIVNYFWPYPIENFDRAIALERSWEHSYADVFEKPDDKNVFSSNFLSLYRNQLDSSTVTPAWFINTTEVETGLQCYLSNVKADSFLFSRDRDLLGDKIRYGINYSTAVNFSSRFPIFSPSAALYQNDDQTYHYVDGGYVENTGAKTMLEIIQSLHQSIKVKNVIPYVIQLRFSQSDSASFPQTGFLNEISSIFEGIYNTRAGSTATSIELLKREVDSLGGHVIEIPLPASAKDVPMSWVFSKRSLNKLNDAVDTIMRNKQNDLHTILPYYKHTGH